MSAGFCCSSIGREHLLSHLTCLFNRVGLAFFKVPQTGNSESFEKIFTIVKEPSGGEYAEMVQELLMGKKGLLGRTIEDKKGQVLALRGGDNCRDHDQGPC